MLLLLPRESEKGGLGLTNKGPSDGGAMTRLKRKLIRLTALGLASSNNCSKKTEGVPSGDGSPVPRG